MNRIGKALAILGGAGACVAFVGSGKAGSGVYQDLELLGQSLSIVRDAYVDPVDVSVLVDYAVRSMVESLDQHSTYLDADELEVVREEAQGTFGGIGLVVASKNGYVTVVAPLDGSPAALAGMRPGDTILEINGETTQGMKLRRAVALLRGTPGTDVRLLVRRRGLGEPFSLMLTRGVITVPSVAASFGLPAPSGARYGYLRVATFTSQATREVRAALERLRGEGCTGYIVDLRANPGGLLEEAVGVTDLFLPEGLPICVTVRRKGTSRTEFSSTQPCLVGDAPVVVLVGEGSASGAEILAAALMDNHRGVVIGRQTFGKGTVQEIRELGDGSAVKLTTARWFTPSGFCIDRELGMVDATRVPPSTTAPKGLLPNLLVDETHRASIERRLATLLTPSWLDSLAARRRPRQHEDPDAEWVITAAVARVEHAFESPDSAAVLVEALQAPRGVGRMLVATELARRWWGEAEAMRYAASRDTVVTVAISVLEDPSWYRSLMAVRATATPDSLPPSEEVDDE